MSESLDKSLTKEEFAHLAKLLKRYAATELDQFDHWTFSLPNCTIYVDISMKPSDKDTENWYTDLDHLFE